MSTKLMTPIELDSTDHEMMSTWSPPQDVDTAIHKATKQLPGSPSWNQFSMVIRWWLQEQFPGRAVAYILRPDNETVRFELLVTEATLDLALDRLKSRNLDPYRDGIIVETIESSDSLTPSLSDPEVDDTL